MKCPKCETEMMPKSLLTHPPQLEYVCPRCFNKEDGGAIMDFALSDIVRTEYVLARPTDDDLRDEVAKAALTGILACPDTVGTYEALVYEAFVYADAFLAERTRRREAKP